MNVPKALLAQYNAHLRKLRKGQYLFEKGQQAIRFYQVEEGCIRMFIPGESIDLVQGLFVTGESFGEPPLIADFPYPTTAQAICATSIWEIDKADFMRLIEQQPQLHFQLTQTLARRLYYKAHMLGQIALENPESRILAIIDYFKEKQYGKAPVEGWYEVPFTRQMLADLCGLRVETVIRKVLQMGEQGQLRLEGSKMFRAE